MTHFLLFFSKKNPQKTSSNVAANDKTAVLTHFLTLVASVVSSEGKLDACALLMWPVSSVTLH